MEKPCFILDTGFLSILRLTSKMKYVIYKYLLIIMIPVYKLTDGSRLVEELWHKDLLGHLEEINELVLASPTRTEVPPEGRYLAIKSRPGQGVIRFVDLPPCYPKLAGALRGVPWAVFRLWRAMDDVEVVHVNAELYGWLGALLAKFRGRFVFMNIESAGWRQWMKPPWRPSRLLRGLVYEALTRFGVNLSDLITFTHAGYRDDFLHESMKSKGHVVPASWVDGETILSDAIAVKLWDEKLKEPLRPLRIVFAGTLAESKGIRVFLTALELLTRRGVSIDAWVYGTGAMDSDVKIAVACLGPPVSLSVGGKVAYGPDFFAMLRTMDILVVPSLSDEQPRVVYDAWSQALPVIASDTPGLRQCVTDGKNGFMIPRGDPSALASTIERLASARKSLRTLGMGGLETARSWTHSRMHSYRGTLIRDALRVWKLRSS